MFRVATDAKKSPHGSPKLKGGESLMFVRAEVYQFSLVGDKSQSPSSTWIFTYLPDPVAPVSKSRAPVNTASSTTPMPTTKHRVAFQELFGSFETGLSAGFRALRSAVRRSNVDFGEVCCRDRHEPPFIRRIGVYYCSALYTDDALRHAGDLRMLYGCPHAAGQRWMRDFG